MDNAKESDGKPSSTSFNDFFIRIYRKDTNPSSQSPQQPVSLSTDLDSSTRFPKKNSIIFLPEEIVRNLNR